MGHIVSHVVLFLSLSLAFVHPRNEDVNTYIVRVQNNKKPSVFAEVQHWYHAALESLEDSNNNNNINTSNSKSQNHSSKLVHVYNTVFHGFSAKLTPRQAQQLKERPWVVSVFPDRVYNLHTTRTPYFLGLYGDTYHTVAGPLLTDSDYGSNVIIGFLDSGIDLEHPSFHDDGLEPLPADKKWRGECAVQGFPCNKKIVGVRYITNGTYAEHGTLTVSTAAGRAIENVSYPESASGTAVGVAPKARIALYKVCDVYGCAGTDILAGFDRAVKDGVDIISVPLDFSDDAIGIGALGATEKGVLVIASAGNGGIVTNVDPWVMTVAAGTIDRALPADLVLENGTRVHGASLYGGPPMDTSSFLTLAYGAECGLLDEMHSGKIVFCYTDDVSSAVENVTNAGGAGVVVGTGVDHVGQQFTIPCLVLTESDGKMILHLLTAKVNTTVYATMDFRGVELGIEPAPAVASFSSRGPNPRSPYVMKPDVLAPGVNILAAWPEGVDQFKLMSGTSMACAHVSGLAALLKALHPKWSPAMIRSAIMTTAYNTANDGKPIINDNDRTYAKTLDMGAGHIDTNKAYDPGLVYDITSEEYYVAFMCASNHTDCSETRPWDLNNPAISIGSQSLLHNDITVKRTVTNVGEADASYTVTVTNPRGVNLTVNPMRLNFTSKGEKQNYSITIPATDLPEDITTAEGKIVWSDGKRQVASPVVIVNTPN
ncbi:subtilase family protein [Striga asiatica]|uniref:Subtilase family protein n=1 Tax=Striga asiatica TaxID=4170 RepID=A0A5A7QL78_STRAF|nr:subtilase family protein [Striga asiatica]